MRSKLEGTDLEKILLIGFFLSGYAALAYEQIWIHLLTLIYGGSTFSYSVLLGAFLSGLGLGSYVFGKFSRNIKNPIMVLGWIELGVAFSSLLILPLFEHLDIYYLRIVNLDLHPWLMPLTWAFLPFFLLVPTSLLGAKFPVAAKFYSTSKATRGRDMGFLYSANTVGSVFGAWWTGFVFIPRIGLEHSYILASLSNFIFASLIFWHVSSPHRKKKLKIYVASALFIAALILTHSNELDTRFAGVYYIAPDMEIKDWVALKKNTRILFNRYSPFGMITVGQDGEVKYLSIDGKPEASNGPLDLDGQYLLGYIPMFAHKNPQKVLHIGIGAGFTLDAIRNFEVDKVDAVEINPLVLAAGRKYFFEETNNVFSDPKINFIIEDGRLFLTGSEEKYDLIITTPSNPWTSTSSHLFTVDFYEIAKDHLAEGGIYSAWAPLYEYSSEDIYVYLNSLNSVFPEILVFITGGDMIILASEEPIEIGYREMLEKTREEEINRHFSDIGTHYLVGVRNVEKIPLTYRLDKQDIRGFVPSTEVSTDDRPILEFQAAKRTILRTKRSNIYSEIDQEILNYKRSFSPPLRDLVDEVEGGKIFGHLNIRIDEGGDWILEDVKYINHLGGTSNSLVFLNEKAVRYLLPDMGDLYLTGIDIFPPPNIKRMEEYVIEILSPESMEYKDDRLIDNEEVAVYEISLAGDTLKGLAYTWYCRRSQMLYIATVAYPKEAVGDMEEPLSRLACIHENT